MTHKTIVNAILVLIAALSVGRAQTRVPVFTSGQDGHSSYRIPAIIALKNGDLLAFAEGRVTGAADFGDINIVMRRSTDKGKSWGPLQILVDRDSLQAGNPAPVVDLLDPAWPRGRVFLFYNTGDNHEGEVRKGKGLREVWYITSTNGGATWSDPVNITSQVHRPRYGRYDFSEDWRSYANTPGHAMQFTRGTHKGRIFVAANHSAGPPAPGYADYTAHGYYSDDHGKTFSLGESVAVPGSNESTAAELGDGRLMMNIRNQGGNPRLRLVAISSTGGATWDTAYFDRTLPDPVCEGTLLTIGAKRGKSILAFCNAADSVHRDNLTLRVSEDDGRTWSKAFPIDKAPAGREQNHAAYSDIVRLGPGQIGVLYERENYSSIVFTAVHTGG